MVVSGFLLLSLLILLVAWGLQLEFLWPSNFLLIFPKFQELKCTGMFAMTEKGHGSNVRQIQTEATFDLDNQVRELFPVSWFPAIWDLHRPPLLSEPASTPSAWFPAIWDLGRPPHLPEPGLTPSAWFPAIWDLGRLPIFLSLAPHPQHVLWLRSLSSEQVVLGTDMNSAFESNTSLCYTLPATNRTQLCTHTL